MGRVKRKMAAVAAALLLLAGGLGAGGKINVKSERPLTEVVQQMPAGDGAIYPDANAAEGNKTNSGARSGWSGDEKAPPGPGTPEAGQAGTVAGAKDVPERQAQPRETAVKSPAGPGRHIRGYVNGRCVHVHDGDTITVRLDESPLQLTRVRLIGVDTPELVPGEFGETAGDYARSLLQGRKVRLVYDKERYDRYGRSLAYVYLPDWTFVNARLVEEGYARVITVRPNTAFAGDFEKLRDEAQKARRGIWAEPPPACTWRGEKKINIAV